MAKLSDSYSKKDKREGSKTYSMIIGEDIASLISSIHAASITFGTDLEKNIIAVMSEKDTGEWLIDDLDAFIDDVKHGRKASGAYLCSKKTAKSSAYNMPDHEEDFLIFVVDDIDKKCSIIEMKAGAQFDTKKIKGEYEQIQSYALWLGGKIPFVVDYYICCFFATDKEKIRKGLKDTFKIEEIMTGKEFCELLKIKFDDVANKCAEFVSENKEFFASVVAEYPEVKLSITKEERKHIPEPDFYNTDGITGEEDE